MHHNYLLQWSNRAQTILHGGPAYRSGLYREYLRWLHDSSRLAIKPPRVAVGAEDLPDSDDEDDLVDEYNQITRHSRQPERAPLHNYMVFVICNTNIVLIHGLYRTLHFASCLQGQQLERLANEAGQALLVPPGSVEEVGHLRAFIEVIVDKYSIVQSFTYLFAEGS